MIVVGLTGGIGSGKTTVAKMFYELGIPIYIADIAARKLMNNNPELIKKISSEFGKKSYVKGVLNRSYLASKVFSDKKNLDQLNQIVHPAVQKDFEEWKLAQDAPYVIKETAILFENGGHQLCDYTILVTAPLEEKFKRVIARDQTSRKAIKERMKNQWDDDKKKELADFVIDNLDLNITQASVLKINDRITSLLGT